MTIYSDFDDDEESNPTEYPPPRSKPVVKPRQSGFFPQMDLNKVKPEDFYAELSVFGLLVIYVAWWYRGRQINMDTAKAW